jgi:hypothetical protein
MEVSIHSQQDRCQLSRVDALRIVKATHTLVWAFFATCILAIPAHLPVAASTHPSGALQRCNR